jgi:hypothetical protein
MLPYAVDGNSHTNTSWTQEQISLSVLHATITAVSLANSVEPSATLGEQARRLADRFFDGETAANLEGSQAERDWMHAVQAAHSLAFLCYSKEANDFEKTVKETFWSADWVGDIHEQGPEAFGLAEAEVLRDIWALQDGDEDFLRGRPLWSKEYRESRLQYREWRLDGPLHGKWLNTDFWARWHQGFLNGSPIDWELQRRLALGVSDEAWETGVETVAREIAAIEAKYAVEEALLAVTNIPSGASADRLGIGGNNPPPDQVIDISAAGEAVSDLEQGLSTISTEVRSVSPNTGRLRVGVEMLKSGVAAVARWIGAKADLAIDESIKQGTKWLCGLASGYIVIHAEKVQQLIDAVLNWLPLL